jgi:hypothetical protein
MKNSIIALALIGAVAARPTAIMKKREVPQEHSHENILQAVNDLLVLDNPDDIQDAVFGLLGAAAAADGAGNIADPGKIPGSMHECNKANNLQTAFSRLLPIRLSRMLRPLVMWRA